MNLFGLPELPPEYAWELEDNGMIMRIRKKGVHGDSGLVATYFHEGNDLTLFLDDTSNGQTQSVSSLEEAVPLMAQACWLGLLVEGL